MLKSRRTTVIKRTNNFIKKFLKGFPFKLFIYDFSMNAMAVRIENI